MVLKNLFTGQQWRNRENGLTDMGRRKERLRCMERVTWKLTLTICKIDSQWEFTVCLRKLKQGLCINLKGWDGEGDRKEIQKGDDSWVIHAEV